MSVRVRLEAAAVARTDFAALGRVTETSDDASEWLGRRVLVPSLTSCGDCDFCRRGAPWGCAQRSRLSRNDGPPAELEVGARYLVVADDGLPAAAAVLAGDGLRAYGAYCASGVAPAEPVVVGGDGICSALVRQIGAAQSAAVMNLEVARADHVAKPWHAFYVEGEEAELATLIDALPAGSTLAVIVAGAAAPALLPLASLAERGIAAHFIRDGHPDLLAELVALAVRRELDLEAAVGDALTIFAPA